MAEKTHQAYPIAPSNGYTRSDGESLVSENELKRKKRIKLFAYIGFFIVFQIIVMTVFGLTVMKVKSPKARWGYIYVDYLNSDPATPLFDTNFQTHLRIKNTNWGPYKFNAGTATFFYQGAAVGQVVIPEGKAGMRSTKKIDVGVSLSTSALPNSSALGTELSSGVLTLTSQVQLKGKVELMMIMKKNKNASMNCTIAFDLSSKTLRTLKCK